MKGGVFLRGSFAFFFSGVITIALCLIAPLMGGNKDVGFTEPVTPIQLLPTPKLTRETPRPPEKPRKIVPLPKLPTRPPQKQPPLEKIALPMKPLQVELPPLQSASIPAAPPQANLIIESGFGDGIFDLSTVDTPPKVQKYVPPVYPAGAKGKHIEGSVLIRCIVTARGKVKDMQVISSEPKGYFEAAALKAVKKWTFIAAKLGGKRVPVYVDVPITFSLDQ